MTAKMRPLLNRRQGSKLAIGLVAAIVIVAGMLVSAYAYRSGRPAQEPQAQLPEATLNANGRKITVELATTPEEQERGLSYRAQIGRDRGMLFLYPQAERQRFWMQGMQFPLDLVFINHDRVVQVERNIPAPVASGLPAIVWPEETADKVLEINSGVAEELGITVGSSIVIE